MNARPEEEDQLVEKIKALLEKEERLAALSKEEIVKIRRIVEVWESFQAFGRFASAARNTVLFAGTLITAWILLWEHIAGFLRRALGGG